MVPQLGNVRLKNTCQGPSSDQRFSCCWDLQALLSELQTPTWKEHCKEPSRNQHNPQEVEKGPKSVNGIQYSQVQRDAQSTAKNRAKYRSLKKKIIIITTKALKRTNRNGNYKTSRGTTEKDVKVTMPIS